jgi:hypothetical protein
MELSRRSMAAVWTVGVEDEPERSAEICVFEVFGDALGTRDGRPVRSVAQAPDSPMQMMAAVFDFPEKAGEAPDGHVPLLAVDRVAGPPSARW